jgi:hypothetical protein
MTAHVARAILEGEGIDCFIADDNLANADPPVIFASGGIRLMVSDDDHERAREIFNRATEGSALPDDFDPGPPIQEDNIPTSQPSGRSTLGKVISACLFMAVGAALYHFYQKSQLPPLTETIKVEEDMDEEGKIDRVTSWLNNRPVHEALDLNGDGNLETTIDNHERGKATQKTDFDLDGEVDLIAFYEGVRYMRQDWLESGRAFKRVRFDGIRRLREELDLDGDGNFEVIRKYNARGERIP